MDVALFILHVVVGLLFVGHGSQKLFGLFGGYGLAGTGEYMDSLGLRPGRLHAALAGLSEVTAGALMALGLLIPLAALLIIAVMVTAALTEHRGKGLWVDSGGFELPLVFTTIAFALAAAGGGQYSLDAELGLGVQGVEWAAGALVLGVAGALGNLGLARASSIDRTGAATSWDAARAAPIRAALRTQHGPPGQCGSPDAARAAPRGAALCGEARRSPVLPRTRRRLRSSAAPVDGAPARCRPGRVGGRLLAGARARCG